MVISPECRAGNHKNCAQSTCDCECHDTIAPGANFATQVPIEERREMVNHPRHYGGADNPYEAIKIIEAHNLNFCLGNSVKYILRCDHKGTPLEDLKKAQWYLNREITNRERADQPKS